MLVLRGAPPAQGGIQILGALVGHVSVIMQRQFQQFVEFFVPLVQFLDRMVDIPAACRSWYAQCTLCSRPWRSHRYSSGDGSGRARCCATTGALVGSRNALFDDGYMLCIIQGGLLGSPSSIHVLLYSQVAGTSSYLRP